MKNTEVTAKAYCAGEHDKAATTTIEGVRLCPVCATRVQARLATLVFNPPLPLDRQTVLMVLNGDL